MCVVLYVFIGLILAKTTFGRHIKAVGDNPQVCRAVRYQRCKNQKFAYIVCGLIVAIAGILMVIRLDYANPYTGNGWEFSASRPAPSAAYPSTAAAATVSALPSALRP